MNKLFLLFLSLSSIIFTSSGPDNRSRSDSNSSTDTVVESYNIPRTSAPVAIRRRAPSAQVVEAAIQVRQAPIRPISPQHTMNRSTRSPEYRYTYNWGRGTPPLQFDHLKTIVIKEKSCEIEDPYNRSSHWSTTYYNCYDKRTGTSLGILHNKADAEKSDQQILQILEDNKTGRCCCWTWKKEY